MAQLSPSEYLVKYFQVDVVKCRPCNNTIDVRDLLKTTTKAQNFLVLRDAHMFSVVPIYTLSFSPK